MEDGGQPLDNGPTADRGPLSRDMQLQEVRGTWDRVTNSAIPLSFQRDASAQGSRGLDQHGRYGLRHGRYISGLLGALGAARNQCAWVLYTS